MGVITVLRRIFNVHLERTSVILRAMIEKRGSVTAINMGTGGYLPYR